jgi:hypothetical protein
MDTQTTIDQLRRERPDLLPALQALTQTCTDDQRAALNTVLQELLAMQSSIHEKRERAARLMRQRYYQSADGKKAVGFSLWHVPDVMVRALCGIAEVPRTTAPSDAWLDEMEARGVSKQLPDGYSEIVL